jgi:hypothetical protein
MPTGLGNRSPNEETTVNRFPKTSRYDGALMEITHPYLDHF